jgi:O-antigen/teichoic acid export membrane protein
MIMQRRRLWRSLGEMRGFALSSMANLALRLAGLASTFLLGVLLARTLGPAEYGLYGLITTLAALGMSVALLGTPQLAVRELSIRKESGEWAAIRILVRKFGVAVAIASAVIAAGSLLTAIAASHADPGTISLALPGSILVALTAACALMAAELRGLGLLIKGQAMDIFARPAAVFLLAVALVAGGFGLTAPMALWIQVFVALLAVLVSIVWLKNAMPDEPTETGQPILTPWMSVALPLGAVDILRQLDGSYGMILMGWLSSDEALGIFRVALACNVVAAMPVTILHIILAPRLGPLHKGGRIPELQSLLSNTSAALTLAVLPIALAAWLIGRPAIEIVFGREYGAAWLPLFLLCVSQLSFGFFGMGPILLAMCEGERELIRIYVVSVAIGIAAAVPLIISYGAGGAAAATITTNSLIGFFSWRYGRRSLGVDSTFLPLLRPLAAQG